MSSTTQWHKLGFDHYELGESPFWHPQEQRLYWVDIPGKKLLRALVSDGVVEAWDMPSEPGCIAPAASGGLVIALRDGVFRARVWGAALERITTLPYDTASVRANDGKCDALGRFWVGTYYEPRDQPLAALYCVDARGPGPAQVTKMAAQSQVANGLAWSPDAGMLCPRPKSPLERAGGTRISSTRSSAASSARARTFFISVSRVSFTATSARSRMMESTSLPT